MSDEYHMTEQIKELYKTIISLKNEEDCAKFFSDLCTYKEIDSMAQRLYAAKLLLDNKTYEQVIEKTSISSATLSRVSKCVKFGEGYKLLKK